MEKMMEILRFAAVLAAAGLLGNWFLAEVRKSRARKEPGYKPYLTVPGILVILAVLVPLFYWIFIKIAG